MPGNINVLFSRFFEIDYRFLQTVDLLCGGSLMPITHVLTALKCPAREVWLLPCFPSLELSLFSFFFYGIGRVSLNSSCLFTLTEITHIMLLATCLPLAKCQPLSWPRLLLLGSWSNETQGIRILNLGLINQVGLFSGV